MGGRGIDNKIILISFDSIHYRRWPPTLSVGCSSNRKFICCCWLL